MQDKLQSIYDRAGVMCHPLPEG